MRRATLADAQQIEGMLNDPSIRPFIGGGDVHLDPSPMLANENNVCLFDEGGGQMFECKGPGIFEAHSFYLVRGKEALDRGREAVARMFADHGAETIFRATPLTNRRARWFNRQLGFQSKGEVEVPGYGPCELFWRNGCH